MDVGDDDTGPSPPVAVLAALGEALAGVEAEEVVETLLAAPSAGPLVVHRGCEDAGSAAGAADGGAVAGAGGASAGAGGCAGAGDEGGPYTAPPPGTGLAGVDGEAGVDASVEGAGAPTLGAAGICCGGEDGGP